jgi:F-type H+-transporting ATPase subunit b
MADQVTNTQHTMEEVHQPDPGHGDQGNPLLAMDPGMVIWTWLIFFVFLIVLRKYAWKPILDSLEEREGSIRKALDDAEATRLSLEEATEEQRRLISEGRQKAAGLVSAARSAATEGAEESRRKAKEESEGLISEAAAQIESEKQAAMAGLTSEAGDLSLLVASKLLDTNLDDDSNRERVKEYLTAPSA